MINPHNWEDSEDFKDFLQLHFQLADASADTRRLVNELLPLAAVEGRMIGAIRTAILKDAIKVFNAKFRKYTFIKHDNRWRFLGSDLTSPLGEGHYLTIFGQLRRHLNAGAYCNHPVREVIQT